MTTSTRLARRLAEHSNLRDRYHALSQQMDALCEACHRGEVAEDAAYYAQIDAMMAEQEEAAAAEEAMRPEIHQLTRKQSEAKQAAAEVEEAERELDRRDDESRDGYISRMLGTWKRRSRQHPSAKATKAAWTTMIEAAFDESEVVRLRFGGGKMLRPRGTFIQFFDHQGRPVLGRVQRHAKRSYGWCEVIQRFRKGGSWTQGS